MKKINESLFVIYDGINNPVFMSQVVVPICRRLEENKKLYITLLSFEKRHVPKKVLDKINACHERLSIVIRKKFLFLGRLSLLPSVVHLFLFLRRKNFLSVTARGALAGWIAKKAFCFLKQRPALIIQARGLAAEEFRYAMKYAQGCSLKRVIKSVLKKYYYRSLVGIEKGAYKEEKFFFTIEAVSSALKSYLVSNFSARQDSIVVSFRDVPSLVSIDQVKEWKVSLRSRLGIEQDADVYCYAGSARPWQCVDEIVAYAAEKCEKEKSAFFLFLSQDHEVFKKRLLDKGLGVGRFLALSVSHSEIYKFLSVADKGIVFREKDIVNWVSRPTKALEYRAVGLTILHNNTVKYLFENNKSGGHCKDSRSRNIV